jgi:hypothetical protein
MEFLTSSFIDENLPYLTLLMGVMSCLLLYLGLGHQLQKLRRALGLQRRRIDSLERQLTTPEGGERESSEPEATRRKVLQLHGLGRSSEEIARQAGLREADVDFVLRVNEHLETSGRVLALRKIS